MALGDAAVQQRAGDDGIVADGGGLRRARHRGSQHLQHEPEPLHRQCCDGSRQCDLGAVRLSGSAADAAGAAYPFALLHRRAQHGLLHLSLSDALLLQVHAPFLRQEHLRQGR